VGDEAFYEKIQLLAGVAYKRKKSGPKRKNEDVNS